MNSLLVHAGRGLEPMRFVDETEPQRADLTPLAEQLEDVEQDCELENALSHVVVSDGVRLECAEEMRRGKQRGWRD
jgi:hypothetical protein